MKKIKKNNKMLKIHCSFFCKRYKCLIIEFKNALLPSNLLAVLLQLAKSGNLLKPGAHSTHNAA